VFLVNSRYPLVCATPISSDRKDRHQQGSSFSRSYGGNLPSSLTIVLPIALVFSTRPPVSVWGTGTVLTHCWDFLGSMGSVTSPKRLGITSQCYGSNSHRNPPTRLPGDYHRPGSPTLLRPPSAIRRTLGRLASRRKQPRRCDHWT
jgi:hypothetical protein